MDEIRPQPVQKSLPLEGTAATPRAVCAPPRARSMPANATAPPYDQDAPLTRTPHVRRERRPARSGV